MHCCALLQLNTLQAKAAKQTKRSGQFALLSHRVLLQTARSRRASAKRRPYRASRRRRAVAVDGVPWRLDVRESIASTAWRWGRTAIHGVHRRDSSLAGQQPHARRRSKTTSKDAPQARRAPPRRAKQCTNQTLRRSLLDGVDGVASMASRWTYRRDAVGERHARFVLTCGAGVLVRY